MWGVSWVNMRMMLADAPRYDYDSIKGSGGERKYMSDDDWLNAFAG